ncbi:GNAT family N-acetyltransferase [Streptomyces sp. NPDC003027]
MVNDAEAARWVQAQQRGWAAGNRFGFAALEAQPDSAPEQLVGNVVLKEVAPGRPAAEVGYWTAAHARGRGVAPPSSGSTHQLGLRPAPPSRPRDGHMHIRRRTSAPAGPA